MNISGTETAGECARSGQLRTRSFRRGAGSDGHSRDRLLFEGRLRFPGRRLICLWPKDRNVAMMRLMLNVRALGCGLLTSSARRLRVSVQERRRVRPLHDGPTGRLRVLVFSIRKSADHIEFGRRRSNPSLDLAFVVGFAFRIARWWLRRVVVRIFRFNSLLRCSLSKTLECVVQCLRMCSLSRGHIVIITREMIVERRDWLQRRQGGWMWDASYM